VLCQLLRRGYIAALAPQGVPNADIIVTDVEGQRLPAIQVKTRRNIGSDGGWHMKAKHEQINSTSLFYCFVDFGDGLDGLTRTYVIPSAVVARTLSESYERWFNTPGQKGQQRKDTVLRRFLPDYTRVFGQDSTKYGPGWMEKFRGAWHQLGPTADEEIDREPKDF
jgi:hypothetical protein